MENLNLKIEIKNKEIIVTTNHEVAYKLPLWCNNISLSSSSNSSNNIEWRMKFTSLRFHLEEVVNKIEEKAIEMMQFFYGQYKIQWKLRD